MIIGMAIMIKDFKNGGTDRARKNMVVMISKIVQRLKQYMNTGRRMVSQMSNKVETK
ncbi:hypothetical protein HPL003_15320 [Paenibacillus terrae HPL-003]|uniref:Uncharacterized protein n=1 Tax=Paenibacillus terrae (strain HPL-003) TaxID=985665 RepID=G7VXQ3_PAETH|nr:hypothetical protein HPL003_15320 [Paenibacillus terrae HPL-003]